MSRRRYTLEFKLSAVKLVNEQGYSIPEAARSLGVDAASVRAWVEKFSSNSSEADGVVPSGEGALKAELRRLRKENARLLMEREILKKAAAFFAKEQP
jgi:transposase